MAISETNLCLSLISQLFVIALKRVKSGLPGRVFDCSMKYAVNFCDKMWMFSHWCILTLYCPCYTLMLLVDDGVEVCFCRAWKIIFDVQTRPGVNPVSSYVVCVLFIEGCDAVGSLFQSFDWQSHPATSGWLHWGTHCDLVNTCDSSVRSSCSLW